MQGLFDLLRTDEVNMAVKPTGRDDLPSPAIASVPGPMTMSTPDCVVRVSCFSHPADATVQQPDIGLVDPRMVNDQRIGDHRIYSAIGTGGLGLSHAVSDHLSSAELHLFSIGREVAFDFDNQIGIGQTNLVPGGGAIQAA